MIIGIGIDLIDNSRVERELTRGGWLAEDGIFTTDEITRCGGGKRPVTRYAACFAAKEATLKALGIKPPDLGMFHEVEVCPSTRGEHAVVVHNRVQARCRELGVRHIRLSIASGRTQTGAVVVLES